MKPIFWGIILGLIIGLIVESVLPTKWIYVAFGDNGQFFLTLVLILLCLHSTFAFYERKIN